MKPSSFHFLDTWRSQPKTLALSNLPKGMQSLAGEISQTDTQQEAVEYAYDFLTRKYRGYRFWTFLRLDRLCVTDLDTLWKTTGFIHCHHLNYLLQTLLIASGKFSLSDIRSRWTHIWFFSPHQYLEIKLSTGKTVTVDLWGKVYGIPFGSHAHGFRSGRLLAQTRNQPQHPTSPANHH